jgi:hypothetical protein
VINVRLTGGLGNQLFQFGAAAVLAQRFDLPIRLWPGSMQSYATPRKLMLPGLVDLERFRTTICDRPNWVQRARLSRLWPGVRGGSAWVSDKNILDVARHDGRLRSAQLDGYFIETIDQSFFDDMLRLVVPALRPPLAHARDATAVCAMHVRGGDFLHLDMEIEGLPEYYRDAVAKVRARAPDVRFVVTTDDPPYAKAVIHRLGIEATILSAGVFADFDALRTADFAILSSSTFSFWAGACRQVAGDGRTQAPNGWRKGLRRIIRLPSEATA